MPNQLAAADDGQQPVLPPVGDVVCFGFLTYLLLIVVESFPSQNAGASILEAVDSLGDDAAIVACTLSRWEVPAALISSSVGNDYYGERVIEQLRASGLTADQRVIPGQKTPLEVGIVDASGSRTYFQRREPRMLASLEMPSVAELSGARMLYVDLPDENAAVPRQFGIAGGHGSLQLLELRHDRPVAQIGEHLGSRPVKCCGRTFSVHACPQPWER